MTDNIKPARKVNRVNKPQAVKLRTENGLTYKEIATIQGVDQAAIHRAIKHLLPTESTKVFINNRGDILARFQERILSSVNDDDIKKASLLQKAATMGIAYDKERLERNLSSFNVDTIVHSIEQIRQLRAERDTKPED